MLKLIIEDDEGRKTVVPFVRDEITIGRQEGNTIRLTERNVSRRHARLVRSNGAVVVEDLGSYNGIRINGERINGQVAVHDGDLIQIGDYDLAIQQDVAPTATPPAPPSQDGEETTAPSAERDKLARKAEEEGSTKPEHPALLEAVEALQAEEAQKPREDAPAASTDAAAARRQSTAIIHVDDLETDRPRKLVDLEAEVAPRLVVLNTELAGREFACIRTELRLGRADDNDIAIDHRSLSRTHAKIVREESGEWRVIDMQSANGVSVNGESYAQATLRWGDVIELGHVKLKFLAPGDEFRFVPEEKKARSKLPALALVLGLALSGGTAAYYFTVMRPKPPSEPPVQPSPAVEAPLPEESPPAEAPKTPEPPSSSVTEKLAEARLVVEAREWERASEKLASCTMADGSLHPEAKALLAALKAEAELKRNIDRAEQALGQGRLEEAKRLLDESEHTKLLAAVHRELRAGLAAAVQAKLASKSAVAVKPPPKVEPAEPKVAVAKAPESPKAAQAEARAAEAKALYEEGVALHGKKQLREARAVLEKCVKVDPTFAACHKALGGVYAKLGEAEKGAYHYKRFLQLAPNDKDADRVRNVLEAYEATKK
ncbi:MAG: FHA domain-containing protein [Myxococcales bacterium]|nr:FHA domain-containing protein [Myxococcales bacterium]